jgi:hypothetical protein
MYIYIQQLLYIQSKIKAKNKNKKQIIVGCIENSQVLYIIYIYTQQILYIRSFTPLPPPKNIQNKMKKQNKTTKTKTKDK